MTVNIGINIQRNPYRILNVYIYTEDLNYLTTEAGVALLLEY